MPCEYQDITGYGDYAWVCTETNEIYSSEEECLNLCGVSPPPTCECTEWENSVCISESPPLRRQYRTCTPSGCRIEQRDIYDETCKPAPPPPECDSDLDCVRKWGEGYICNEEGKCVRDPAVECVKDSECPSGYKCEGGVCVPIEPPPNGDYDIVKRQLHRYQKITFPMGVGGEVRGNVQENWGIVEENLHHLELRVYGKLDDIMATAGFTYRVNGSDCVTINAKMSGQVEFDELADITAILRAEGNEAIPILWVNIAVVAATYFVEFGSELIFYYTKDLAPDDPFDNKPPTPGTNGEGDGYSWEELLQMLPTLVIAALFILLLIKILDFAGGRKA